MNDSQSRLERARFQYENLLLHAGNTLLLSTTPPRARSLSPPLPPSSTSLQYATNKRISPVLDRFDGENDNNRPPFLISSNENSPLRAQYPLIPTSSTAVNTTTEGGAGVSSFLFYDNKMPLSSPPPPLLTSSEKDEIILSLQEENEKLREKLENAIEQAQQVILDAQESNEELVSGYESRIRELEEKNRRLEDENRQLKVSLELAQAERDVERDQLSKSLKVIDRFKRRSKEYLEIQKKTHQILSATDGLHFTIYPKGSSGNQLNTNQAVN